MTLHVLKIGDSTRTEAAPLAAWIAHNLQPADMRESISFTEACAQIARTNWIPDLVIIFQAWSDEYTAAELAILFSVAPLARVTVCQGAWCESDGRTRQVWPVALRTSVNLAPQRLMREWRVLTQQSVFPLFPASASRDEVFDADHPTLIATKHPSIGVDSPDSAYRDFSIELLKSVGFAAGAIGESNTIYNAIVFDADPLPIRHDRLQVIRHRFAKIPIVAVAASPYAEQTASLSARASTQLLLNSAISKPSLPR